MNKKELYKKLIKELKNVKIILRLEKDGKYIEEKLDPKIIDSLLCIQIVMYNELYKTSKLYNIEKYIDEFFNILSHFGEAMYDNMCYTLNEENKFIEYKNKFYPYGKPKWKNININNRKKIIKRYHRSSKGIKALDKANKKYRSSEKGKETKKKYNNTNVSKLAMKEYNHSKKGKKSKRKYEESDKGKATRKRYNKKVN